MEFLLVNPSEEKATGNISAIPFKEALGVGEYAVTIADSSAFVDLSKLNIAADLLAKNVKVIDTKVLTKRGRMLGHVTEYMIDQDTGSIPFVTFKNQANEELAIPLDSILSFGQQVLFVVEEIEDKLQKLDGMSSVEAEKKSESVAPVQTIDTAAYPPVQEEVEEEVEVETEIPEEVAETEVEAPAEETSTSSVELFIQKQKSFLIGKKLKQAVTDSEGKVIAPVGATITDEIFEQVYKLGRQKIIELTMIAE